MRAQVGVKMAFQGSQGQLALFLGNKGDTPLERLVCAVPPVPQFAFQVGPVPKRLEPKKQMQARRPAAAAALGTVASGAVRNHGSLCAGAADGGVRGAVCHAAAAAAGLCMRRAGAEPQPGAARGGRQVLHAAGRSRAARDILPALARAAGCARPPPRALSESSRQACCCCNACCTHPASRACAAGPPQRLGQRVVRAPPALGRAPVEAMLASLSLGVQAGLDPDPDNAVAVATFTYTPLGQQPRQARPRLELQAAGAVLHKAPL